MCIFRQTKVTYKVMAIMIIVPCKEMVGSSRQSHKLNIPHYTTLLYTLSKTNINIFLDIVRNFWKDEVVNQLTRVFTSTCPSHQSPVTTPHGHCLCQAGSQDFARQLHGRPYLAVEAQPSHQSTSAFLQLTPPNSMMRLPTLFISSLVRALFVCTSGLLIISLFPGVFHWDL